MERQAAKKGKERTFFDMAQRLSTPYWPAGEVCESERPDFIIHTSHEKYGVEVVELMQGDIRAIEVNRSQICKSAYSQFLEKFNTKSLAASVAFKDGLKWTRQEREAAASELCTIIISYMGPHIKAVLQETIAMDLECGEHFESQIFNQIWLHYLPTSDGAIWQPSAAFWVPVASVDKIQDVIDEKEQKISEYQKNVDSIWLLIVMDGFSGATAWSIDDKVISHHFETEFDNVVLLDRAMNKTHTLLRA